MSIFNRVMLLLFYFTVITSPTCTGCLDQSLVVVLLFHFLLSSYFSPALCAWTKQGGLSKLAGGEIHFGGESKTWLLSFYLFCLRFQILAIWCGKLHYSL